MLNRYCKLIIGLATAALYVQVIIHGISQNFVFSPRPVMINQELEQDSETITRVYIKEIGRNVTTDGTLTLKTSERQLCSANRNTTSRSRAKYIEKLKTYPVIPMWTLEVKDKDLQDNGTFSNDELEMFDVNPSATNVTPPNVTLLIYNRVPKCGSTTFNAIIKEICKINHLACVHSGIYHKHWMSVTDRIAMMKQVTNRQPKNKLQIFERHFYFFNVTELGFARPVWINLVREPISRFISHFYYSRIRSRWKSLSFLKKLPFPPNWWFDMNINDCIAAKRPECHPSSPDLSMQLTFFCGHHPECRNPESRFALHIAKRNVELEYSAVGILEELPLSLKILERYLPSFMKNSSSTPQSSGKVILNRNALSQRNPVSKATRDALSRVLGKDIEFYNFLRQRLHLQANALGIKMRR